MEVLGIDVGLQTCGYVITSVKGLNIKLLKEGEIKPDTKISFPAKLNYIFQKLSAEVSLYRPEAIVVEKLYSHYRHPVTLGILAQIRGVVALLAHREKIGFFEYSPTRARKCFLGKGNVNSEQVKKMAENMTGKKFQSVHTADAFSLIAAFSHEQKFQTICLRAEKSTPA